MSVGHPCLTSDCGRRGGWKVSAAGPPTRRLLSRPCAARASSATASRVTRPPRGGASAAPAMTRPSGGVSRAIRSISETGRSRSTKRSDPPRQPGSSGSGRGPFGCGHTGQGSAHRMFPTTGPATWGPGRRPSPLGTLPAFAGRGANWRNLTEGSAPFFSRVTVRSIPASGLALGGRTRAHG